MGRDDVICPLAAIAFGFREPNEEYLKGFASIGMYCKDEEAATRLEAGTWKFEPGSYDYVCVAPLNRATFEPDVIAIYANNDLARRQLGWKIEFSLEEMMATAWRWEQKLKADEKFYNGKFSKLN